MEHFDSVLKKYKIPRNLKLEQREVVASLLQERHVMAVLPTGFGKSLCFMLPALLKNEVSTFTFHLLKL